MPVTTYPLGRRLTPALAKLIGDLAGGCGTTVRRAYLPPVVRTGRTTRSGHGSEHPSTRRSRRCHLWRLSDMSLFYHL